MTRPNTYFIIVANAIALTSGAHAQTEYVNDDGERETNAFADEPDLTITYGNYFFAQPGAETITTLSVSFPELVVTLPGDDPDPGDDPVRFGPPAGTPFTMRLFNDPDNDLDPRNAELIAEATGITTGFDEPNMFDTLSLDPTRVDGGFFVSVEIATPLGTPFANFDLDLTGNADRSWLFSNASSPLDTTDLSTGTATFFSDSPLFPEVDRAFSGSFLVRATGVPSPGSLALVGVYALTARRRR